MKLLSILVLLITTGCWFRSSSSPFDISVTQVRQRMDSPEVVLLDVRTPPEYQGPLGHLEGSLLIPVQELEQRLAELEPYRDREIIVYCRSGDRSRTGTRLLLQHGYRARNMQGGMLEWNRIAAPPLQDTSALIIDKSPYRICSGRRADAKPRSSLRKELNHAHV